MIVGTINIVLKDESEIKIDLLRKHLSESISHAKTLKPYLDEGTFFETAKIETEDGEVLFQDEVTI